MGMCIYSFLSAALVIELPLEKILYRDIFIMESLQKGGVMAGGIKSSIEIAMEKVKGMTEREEKTLTAEQKAKIAEIKKEYEAKIAEKEIIYQAKIEKESSLQMVERLRKRLEEEKASLWKERDAKIDAVMKESSHS